MQLSWAELNKKMMEPVEQRGHPVEQQMVALDRTPDWEVDLAPCLLSQVVDLTPYVNTSALKVAESMSLERAYIMFRNMGLRHMIVVDAHNRVKGILTRKDLLGFKLDEAVSRALLHVESRAQMGDSSWVAHSPPPHEWNGTA